MLLIVSLSLLFGGYAALWKNLFIIEYLLILVFFFSLIVFIFFTEYMKIYLTFLFSSLFAFIYVTYNIFIFESELIKWQVALNRNDKCIVQVVNVVPNVIKKEVLLNIVSCGEYVFRKKLNIFNYAKL